MTTTATTPTEEQQPEQSKGNAAVEWLKGQYALFILIVLLIIAALSSPAFLTGTNITNLLLQMSIIGVVVMAELIIVLTGGIDISVGSALGLAAVLCAGLFGGFSVWLALLVGMAVGGIIGLVNGWLVSFRGLEPFIVTLGMLALARGLVYAYSEGIPITPEASETFAQIGQTTVLGIPVLTLLWIAMVLIVAFLLRRTVWGRRVYAIGSNKEAARSSGIPVRATLWSVYILGGLLFGAVVGTIIFQVIANLLSLLNVSTFLQDAFRGALILVAVTLATVQFARKRSPSTQPATK
jgi:ribose transport system permease protein